MDKTISSARRRSISSYTGAEAPRSAQTFEDTTSLYVSAFGGSGTNFFQGGAGQDDFYGGSGSNTFDAGIGCDVMVGGNGHNVFNENATASGEILEVGNQNTVNVPPHAVGSYAVY